MFASIIEALVFSRHSPDSFGASLNLVLLVILIFHPLDALTLHMRKVWLLDLSSTIMSLCLQPMLIKRIIEIAKYEIIDMTTIAKNFALSIKTTVEMFCEIVVSISQKKFIISQQKTLYKLERNRFAGGQIMSTPTTTFQTNIDSELSIELIAQSTSRCKAIVVRAFAMVIHRGKKIHYFPL